MSTFDYALIAAATVAMLIVLSAAVAATLFYAWKLLTKLERSQATLAVECSRMLPYVTGVYQELVYMREMATAAAGGQAGAAIGPPQVPQRMPPVPYPSPDFSRFGVEIPDAKVEDTDVDLLNQTDEELVEMEKLENMRQQGMEVEDSNAQHNAIVAEAP